MICVCSREEAEMNSPVQRGKKSISHLISYCFLASCSFCTKMVDEETRHSGGPPAVWRRVVRELLRDGRMRAHLGSDNSRSSIILSRYCCSGLRELTGDLGGVSVSFNLLSNRRCILQFPEQGLQAIVCLEVT